MLWAGSDEKPGRSCICRVFGKALFHERLAQQPDPCDAGPVRVPNGRDGEVPDVSATVNGVVV
ncbi:hypothetical protein GCM10007231_00100 [Nocardioides daphniae]|uniref:Uncharacterized protein n=1 Tax=Nocardioides daphniae TaxID=402297 RepID=A0ABQ1PWG2_9ACTN|nr:hypothetical protein GCM10007231_00100 [Nocardioides daphniae]